MCGWMATARGREDGRMSGCHGSFPCRRRREGTLSAYRSSPELGISERRSYGRDLQRPFRGVRSHGLDLTALSDRCAAYLPRMNPDQFFSHSTAAMLHGIPVPLSLWRDARLHVSALRPAYPARHHRGYRASAPRLPWCAASSAGLPVADPVTTWCLLGSVLGVRDLIAAADYLVGSKPKATLAELETAVAAWYGQNGAAALRAAPPIRAPSRAFAA